MSMIILTGIFLFLILRNEIVFRARLKALHYIGLVAQKAVDEGDKEWRRFYLEFKCNDSAIKQIFSLTKWRYRDFYPYYKEIEASGL